MSRRQTTARHSALPPRSWRVLVADDHADTRALYGEYLAHRGFDVALAADGREAIAKARAFAPDVVLLDLSMPHADGITAARAIRALPAPDVALVYLMTAYDVDPRFERAVGIQRLLVKPFAPHDLVAWLECDLETRRLARPETG